MSSVAATVSVIVSLACPHCDIGCAQSDVGYFCAACGWREDQCEKCTAVMVFSPGYRGFTSGGLAFAGALECSSCNAFHVCRRSRPLPEGDWKISATGLSLTAGVITLRAERADEQAVRSVMKRIERVPEHEANEIELERLYDLITRPGWARSRC